MKKEVMIQWIKEYLADHLNCHIKDLEQEGTVFVVNKKMKEPFLEIATKGQAVIVSASKNILPKIRILLEDKSRDEIFECPFVYGQSIYYCPDLKKMVPPELPSAFQYELLEEDEIQKLNDISGFENSLGFDEKGNTPTVIVFLAKSGNEIIGIAGASKVSSKLWEVGIDVKAEYRGNGLATKLVKYLSVKILDKGILPFYCASTTNIASQGVAYKSGYVPCWVSTFRTILDGSSVYDDIVREMKLV